jgi:acyl carrier protein
MASKRERLRERPLTEPALSHRELVESVVRARFDVPADADGLDLLELGYVDSLGLIELIAELETVLGVELPLDQLELDDLRSIDRICAFLDRAHSGSG